ncbi:MAG: 2-oxoacid:acceptor oxidoreductase subunit alpha [Verrucomicrobiales bacterium]|nr:2-oxoacid:acceptor oxidoreductase subunit alpha [Verrucomicrobiales bacterium]MBP9223901.1 2-oxoacid:acceptor oxidoreductase subunit alpha [Verrucomicrobiales bacterium]
MTPPATSGSPESVIGLSDHSEGITELQNAVIRFAGNSQDGIQTIGGFLARLAGRSAREVMTYMTIPSTISGGPSIFQVHLGSGEVLSAGDESDFLFAFYQHSYDNHIGSLKSGGICIYDSDHVETIRTDVDAIHVPIPITSTTVEAIGGSAKDRGKNLFVLGLVTAIFKLDKEKITSLVSRQFGGKSEDILRNAMLAFDAGFAYPVGDLMKLEFGLMEGKGLGADKVTTDGNTALTMGLLAGGVRYGSAYPITPWSTIMEQLRVELPKYGGIFVQAEDELAAVSMALGMAYAGHTAVTGSSGPGLSLKMEALSYAVMAELPLIVVNVQRGGPSTGLPTSVEQSDLMQAIYGSHGDCPRIVLAPQNVSDCFYIAVEACELARTYSCPVIILTDQALASRIEAFAQPDLESLTYEPSLALGARGADFKPYPLNGETRHAPPGSVMEGGKYPVVTGLEHDEWGHPSGSPAMHTKMTVRRREKIKRFAATLPLPEVFGDESGEVLIVGWGSSWGPIRESVMRMREGGVKVGAIHLRHIHPMPNSMETLFANYRYVVVVEMNDEGLYGYGQLATLLRAKYCDPKIHSVCKTDGLNYQIREIVGRVTEIINPA